MDENNKYEIIKGFLMDIAVEAILYTFNEHKLKLDEIPEKLNSSAVEKAKAIISIMKLKDNAKSEKRLIPNENF